MFAYMRVPNIILAAVWLLLALGVRAQESDEPVDVEAITRHTYTYTSGKNSFEGYLFKPAGKGPFPAVVWNHGHTKHLLTSGAPASEYDNLGKIFTNDGYVLFVPDRHMHDVTSVDYSAKLAGMINREEDQKQIARQKYIEYHEVNGRDVTAAVEWIRKQPYVDATRVAVSGWSSGGIASLLAAENDPTLRACIPFSPGVSQWKESGKDLGAICQRVAKNAKMPIFVVQATNDATLAISDIFKKEFAKKEPRNRVEIYPYTGNNATQLSSLAIAGWELWGYDVMTFLEKVMKK